MCQFFLCFFFIALQFPQYSQFSQGTLRKTVFTLIRFLYDWKCEMSNHPDLNRKIVWPKEVSIGWADFLTSRTTYNMFQVSIAQYLQQRRKFWKE